MNEQNLVRLEAQLERLIEGAFAQLFSKTVRAQDIALQLARAMEDDASTSQDGDSRPLAPDHYVIAMHPEVRAHLLERQPALLQILSQHLIELATDSGYRLNSVPVIELVSDDTLTTADLTVKANHTPPQENRTAVMQPVVRHDDAPPPSAPRNPQLIINGERSIPITQSVLNLGRGRDNHVVLDDPYISRHHAQMRLRFGSYTLFDTNSQTGTFVNDVRIREHRLQPGDVIRMGKVQLVYLEDEPASEITSGDTALDA